MAWLEDATNIAFVALILFAVLLIWLGVPGKLMALLDGRSQEIARELQDARRLREEAERLLAQYRAKRAAAEVEAQAIVNAAKEQAAAVAEATRQNIEAAMARRERQAEDRIANAEAKAADEVRAAAAEAALAAAERMIPERMSDDAQSALLAEGAAEMKRKFA